MRYTDRDCYAALVRVAATCPDMGVSLPTGPKWAKELEELAARLCVPVRRWGTSECQEGPRLVLDHSPVGGVRPMICEAGKASEHTPPWWVPSAGIGPGAVPRKEFCHILSALERGWGTWLPENAEIS